MRILPWLKRRILQVPRVAKQQLLYAKQQLLYALPLRDGVLFIGYAEGALGLGQSFRAKLMAAETANLAFAVYPFRVNIETRLIEPYMQHRYDKTHPYSINVIEVAADQVPEVFRALAPQLLANSYNILCTYWELPAAPEEWREYLAGIHEIWAPNKFVATAFAKIFNGPIIVMPPAIEYRWKSSRTGALRARRGTLLLHVQLRLLFFAVPEESTWGAQGFRVRLSTWR